MIYRWACSTVNIGYHSYCVDRWLVKMSNRCPLCKQRVSISLLCPWNKQRRKKGFGGSLATEVEASVDESPPLPPLATLTPSNWFGEEIMSGKTDQMDCFFYVDLNSWIVLLYVGLNKWIVLLYVELTTWIVLLFVGLDKWVVLLLLVCRTQ